MSYHQTIIEGRLGKDPEMRYTAGGDALTTFSVAVDDGYGDNKRVEWYNVTCWRKTAEIAVANLTKGREVMIVGRNRTRSWDGADGKKRYATELVCDRLVFVGPRPADAGPASYADPDSWDGGSIDPDDMPFA